MVAGDGMASEGNLKEELRDNVRREFYYHDGSNRTLVLHHPGERTLERCKPRGLVPLATSEVS